MADIKEKLNKIKMLIDECLAESDGESYEEEDSEMEDSSGDEPGDKIKMAAAMLKRKMGE